MHPTVSVIIPTYDRAEFVWQAVQSVLGQTYSDYELIVVDDGSIDATGEMLRPLAQEGRLKYFYQKNQGRSTARNVGIHLAQGDYVAFLDSDDLWMPEKLQKQVYCLKRHPEAGLVQSWFTKFDQDSGLDLGIRNTNWFSGSIYPGILLHWSDLIAIDTVLIRMSAIHKVGYFHESLHHGEDLDYWRRVSRHYPFVVLPEILTKVRVHSGSMSARKLPSSAAFRVYLEKAFADDSSLSVLFRRKALSRMYSYAGYNQLGASSGSQVDIIWRDCWNAIINWPFEWNAYLCILLSLIPLKLRQLMHRFWSRIRYMKIPSL